MANKKTNETPEVIQDVKKEAVTPVVTSVPKRTEDKKVRLFITRKLKALNEMEDRAKARFLAERVLANKGV